MRPSVTGYALAVLLLVFVLPFSAQSAGSSSVEYDSKKDAITIEAANADIEDVLSEISFRTGIKILIDPEVKKQVNINLQAVPLESALHQIARGLSYALFYESGRGKQRVVGMRLVPKGQPGSAPLRDLSRAAQRQPTEALSYTGSETTSDLSDGTVVKRPLGSRRGSSDRGNGNGLSTRSEGDQAGGSIEGDGGQIAEQPEDSVPDNNAANAPGNARAADDTDNIDDAPDGGVPKDDTEKPVSNRHGSNARNGNR